MAKTIGTIYHLISQGEYTRPFNFGNPMELSPYALDRLGPRHYAILQNIMTQIKTIYGDKANYIQRFQYRQYEMIIISSQTNRVLVSSELNLRRNFNV